VSDDGGNDQPEAPALDLPGLPPIPPALAQKALRHASYAEEQGLSPLESNQRLEFLGDAVLGLVIAEFLCEACPEAPEGTLTKIKASVVCAPALAAVARSLGLGDLLALGRGEELTGGRDKPSLLADALEALVGAAYLAAGLDGARRFVRLHFAPLISERLNSEQLGDYKSALQELIQEHTKQGPSYVLERTSGPDHAKTFYIRAEFQGMVIGSGQGQSRKSAEQEAARSALEQTDAWLPHIVPNASEEPH